MRACLYECVRSWTSLAPALFEDTVDLLSASAAVEVWLMVYILGFIHTTFTFQCAEHEVQKDPLIVSSPLIFFHFD